MEKISESLLTFLLNAAWQVVLVAALAALANYLMRKGPASHRHAVWGAALLAALLLPLTSVPSLEPSVSPGVSISFATPATSAGTHAVSPSTHAPTRAPFHPASIPFSRTAASAIVAVYLAFLLFRSARFAWAWTRTVQIRSRAEARELPPVLERVWARCLQAFGITSVELLTSPAISGPVTVGAFRPVVIVPEHFLTETSEDILSAALGHELAHIKRRDFALNLIYELLYAPVSFHPACWLIRREIEKSREMACDEAVTARLLEPRIYARSIMKIAAAVTNESRPGLTLGVFDGSTLELRIRRLLERPGENLKRARLLLATALSALAVCVVVASSLALSARPQSEFQTQMRLAGDAYNAGDFKRAVEHFTTAVTLQPASINAKLFLANALMRHAYTQQGPPDTRFLSGAVQLYQEVLARDPQNKQATSGMIAIAIDNQQLREAREWAEKLAAIDANDKTAWYTLGLLNWATVFPEIQRAKEASGTQQHEYIIRDPNVRENLRSRYLPQVEEGLELLQKALLLDPAYEQAMAYTNLLYRLKAGLVDDAAQAQDLMGKADEWVRRALETKKRQALPPGPPPIEQLNVDGPPPGPAGRQTIAKAPPPPPPPPPPRDVNRNE